MIYTVTLNPALDYVVHVGELKLGAVNRSSREDIHLGGKGINVSLVLKELGIPSRALGFVAGFTGRAIQEGLAEQGVETDFVSLPLGLSRINLKLKTRQETELNAQGPPVPEEALDHLLRKLEALEDGDTLVLAGSIPGSLPSDVYERILNALSCRDVRILVDATGDLLLRVLRYRPFLIKPNNHELGELFGVSLHSVSEITYHAARLQDMGARNVLVSMAGDGAVLLDEQGRTHVCGVCRGTLKNSVGAGDSMVAGFLAGLEERQDYDHALKLGTAAGGATAFSDGLARREEILALMKQL